MAAFKKGRAKTGGRTAGTPNKATIGVKALLAAVLPDDRMKKEWNKWLRHRDPHIAFAAFKLALAENDEQTQPMHAGAHFVAELNLVPS